MKRYHMYIEWDELNGDYAKETESPDGEWVKYEDAQKLEVENKVLKLALADVAEGWSIANSKRGDWGLTYTAEEYAEKAMRKAEALTKKEAK